MTPRIRKPKHKRIYIPDPMRFSFGVAAASLDSFKALPLHEQGVMLLRRFAEFVPEGQTFYPHSVSRSWSGGRDDWNQISYGFPSSEPWDAKRYLLTHPLSEIVRAGYIAEAPPGSGRYRFTAEGRAVVMSYISPVWGGRAPPLKFIEWLMAKSRKLGSATRHTSILDEYSAFLSFAVLGLKSVDHDDVATGPHCPGHI